MAQGRTFASRSAASGRKPSIGRPHRARVVAIAIITKSVTTRERIWVGDEMRPGRVRWKNARVEPVVSRWPLTSVSELAILFSLPPASPIDRSSGCAGTAYQAPQPSLPFAATAAT